jgi:hypothetical protein
VPSGVASQRSAGPHIHIPSHPVETSAGIVKGISAVFRGDTLPSPVAKAPRRAVRAVTKGADVCSVHNRREGAWQEPINLF